MNSDFLKTYERELFYLRSLADEFARENPQLAGELASSGDRMIDPFVERLMEGSAFLNARVRQRLDTSLGEFAERALDIIHPHLNAPTPSFGIFQFLPDYRQADLTNGAHLPKGTQVVSELERGQRTPVSYSTGHDVTLWPIELTSVAYVPNKGSLANLIDVPLAENRLRPLHSISAAIELTFELRSGSSFSDLSVGELDLHIPPGMAHGDALLRHLIADSLGIVIPHEHGFSVTQASRSVKQLGLAASEALLPQGPSTQSGYRLLQEWINCPGRLSFVRLADLSPGFSNVPDGQAKAYVLLSRSDHQLDSSINLDMFKLFCTPVVNLFERQFARMDIEAPQGAVPVYVDRSRPMDYEVYDLTELRLKRLGGQADDRVLGWSSMENLDRAGADFRCSLSRETRITTGEAVARRQVSSSYVSSEAWLQFQDLGTSGSGNVADIEVRGLCTNRDLPLSLGPQSVFRANTPIPLKAAICTSGPTRPRPSPVAVSRDPWKAVSGFTSTHFPLVLRDNDGTPLKAQLRLLCDGADDPRHSVINGIIGVRSEQITRRVPGLRPATLVRGTRLQLLCDRGSYEGYGLFQFGTALSVYLQGSASINSFVDLELYVGGWDTVYADWVADIASGNT